ncbi:MAG: T9SS type A sorting domain-containing protein [Flavobacteriales bacterium]|nr:T9SS type A sorting domain-containing protein [Flavobacteriales bacterium]
MNKKLLLPISFVAVCFGFSCEALATTYHVGPGQTYTNISDVPLESLAAGDSVLIHYRAQPYAEKFVIGATGTSANPVVIMGIPSGNLKPVITGENATTRLQLDYWSEGRGVIKVGGTSTPNDNAAYVEIRDLEIRTARTGFSFTDDGGNSASYSSNAAAVFIENGDHITISHCDVHDCGNGIFAAWQSSDVLIEYCYIYDNGIENSIYEHNTYTESQHITYQFNRFGRLRTNCPGNNLKDRSAGTVIRYNWIEGGNRQLDLVESDHDDLINMPEYHETFVYNNVLLEYDGEGNSQILHYGGDNGTTSQYRKGMLYFYHNTIVSTRNGNTTLMRLSTDEEKADVRNNVIYADNGGSSLAMVDDDGYMELRNNWINTGWKVSHSNVSAFVTDVSGNLTGSDPMFVNMGADDYTPAPGSPLINNAGPLAAAVSSYPPLFAFETSVPTYISRSGDLTEIGAYLFEPAVGLPPEMTNKSLLYPNPATMAIMLVPASPGSTVWKLFDVYGQEVREISVNGPARIERGNLPAGMYMLVPVDSRSSSLCIVFVDP